MSFASGTLWQKILKATEHAQSSGALLSMPTESGFIDASGMRFFVRILTSLRHKDEAGKQQEKEELLTGKQANPFLPYEKDLFVSDISDTHVAILNKFNVLDHHLLIVTREFEDQETLLTPQDFKALWLCMSEYNGLGFYNAGEIAGASQRHKHFQMVPLPLASGGPQVPIGPLLAKAIIKDDFGIVPAFPFQHVLARIGPEIAKSPVNAAEKTFKLYGEMLCRVNMIYPDSEGLKMQSRPYCLLVTRNWMLLVPRSREFFGAISVNSLGFAGAFLVRNKEQMEILKGFGPMNILKDVALPVSGKQK